MADETKPIPAIAMTALQLATTDYNRQMQAIAAQILEAMNLSPADGWLVDFSSGHATRSVPE